MTKKRSSGGQRTTAARLAKMRAIDAENGLVRVEVKVPADRADEIREIARTMRPKIKEIQ